MTPKRLFAYSAIAIAAYVTHSAEAIPITQVRGKFDCPELNNQQLCAEKAEHALLATHPELARRQKGLFQIRLRSGRFFSLIDSNSSLNIVDRSSNGLFLAIREQFSEGNTWRLLDLRSAKLTEIKGYPLFSPDGRKFVAASEDLDADYSDTVFDVWNVTTDGVSRAFQGIPDDKSGWAARNVRWDGNNTIRFNHTTLKDNGYEEKPSVLVLRGTKWIMR